jgi:hypothetical protein
MNTCTATPTTAPLTPAELEQVEGGLILAILFFLAADHLAGHPILGGCVF